jgi:hypothetical protein
MNGQRRILTKPVTSVIKKAMRGIQFGSQVVETIRADDDSAIETTHGDPTEI